MKVICRRCKANCTLESFDVHDCVFGFINQVKSDDADSFKTALSEMQTNFNRLAI